MSEPGREGAEAQPDQQWHTESSVPEVLQPSKSVSSKGGNLFCNSRAGALHHLIGGLSQSCLFSLRARINKNTIETGFLVFRFGCLLHLIRKYRAYHSTSATC